MLNFVWASVKLAVKVIIVLPLTVIVFGFAVVVMVIWTVLWRGMRGK